MNTPRRYELKYVLDTKLLSQAHSWIHSNIASGVRYPRRNVHSIYFDTPDLKAGCDNLAGLSDRQKVRLRWYSSLDGSEVRDPRLEIKVRKGRLNHKRVLTVDDSCRDLLQSQPRQREIHQLVNAALNRAEVPLAGPLLPTLQLQYQRDYFESPDGVRVTIDQQILFHRTPLHAPLFFGRKTKQDSIIMEIKFDPDQHALVARLMKSLNLVPKRHSKYVSGLAHFNQLNYL